MKLKKASRNSVNGLKKNKKSLKSVTKQKVHEQNHENVADSSKKSKTNGSKKSINSTKKKKVNLENVTTEEFLEQDFENDMDSDDELEANGTNNDNEDADSSECEMDPVEHRKSLMRLKDTDPEFYTYLKQNDKKLLDFNISEDDDDDESNVDDTEGKHVPDDNLEVASDESDFDAEDIINEKGSTRVTLQLLKKWEKELESDKSSKTIRCVVEAFHATLQTVAETKEKKTPQFKVEGGAVFNGMVQLCIFHLPDAFKRFLKITRESSFQAHKCKKFAKIKGTLKLYLADLIKILQNVTSSNIQSVLLKHLHHLLPYTYSFSSLVKPLVRILLKLWTSAEESVRVISFLCILRLATNNCESVLEMLLKTMYVKYVENAKFVSPTTLPGINFMRHSLVEIYLLDGNVSYNHAFLYIRQLAIHLRNALTLKKKEHFQAVYNWQYINSLHFWSDLICSSKAQSMLRNLLYPLVQVTIGTIKLIPTVQYYPLRFHCVQILTHISKETNTFIPILPFLLEVLNSYDFNKKHKVVSMKPLPLTCVLRMSKSQLQENGFKDSVIDTTYQLVLENAAKDSHLIYFPDLYIPCIIQMKAFLKKCHIAKYAKKIKHLLEKIEENRKYIESQRNSVVFDLNNMPQIVNWENRIKSNGTAISKFYDSWIKIHQSKKTKLLTKNDELAEYNLPTLRKSKKQKVNIESSDEESELEFRIKGTEEEASPTKEKTPKDKMKKKKIKKNINTDDLPLDDTDIVEDINNGDWD